MVLLEEVRGREDHPRTAKGGGEGQVRWPSHDLLSGERRFPPCACWPSPRSYVVRRCALFVVRAAVLLPPTSSIPFSFPPLPHALAHSHTRALTHSRTHALTHPPTHSLTTEFLLLRESEVVRRCCVRRCASLSCRAASHSFPPSPSLSSFSSLPTHSLARSLAHPCTGSVAI